ncbi:MULTISPECIES: DUF5937 family protein [unclassified Streptomyces]|uniref:DUF5937 family protein n=1 Tax=unclassified Streptomyces TaxID=2593676 RepID=UPI00109E82FD|nr:DUF5937 family protein [Streptomyces sp. A1136]THA52523.1 ArsR family transcriptional regulator [Streptomyces sp. A1136]
MAYRFRFEPVDLLRCRFSLSPRWETQEAVRVLRDPNRQTYHLPWLRGIRETARTLDLRPLWLLMPRKGHHPDFLSPPPLGPSVTIAEELARVRATDPGAAGEELRRSLACTPGASESELGRRMLEDPARAVQELADLHERAWEALIAPHWPRLRALLEADILFHSRRLAAGGLEALFDGLHPDLSWSHDTLTVERAVHHERRLDGQGLLLMPSAFVWPEVVGGYDPPWQPTLVYPARGIGALWTTSTEATPGPLAALLGRARADILCALTEPASTTALAALLGLAPSTVSAHLKTLRAAGLLLAARHGHQVFYERTPLAIALTNGGPT